MSVPRWMFGVPLLFTIIGCDRVGQVVEEPRTAAFEEIFEQVERIVLDEPEGRSLTRIFAFDVAPDGSLVVTSAAEQEVRLHSRSGRLLRVVGGPGDGPGEFRLPAGATLIDGRLFVFDSRNSRVTRFREDFSFDTIFPVAPGEIRGGALQFAHAGQLVLHTVPTFSDPERPMFRFFDTEGRELRSLHVQDPLYYTVPYWRRGAEPIALMEGSDTVVVANRKHYPLLVYDGEGRQVGTFGTPPASWSPASRPAPGEFSGPNGQAAYNNWVRSYTWIDQVAFHGDSLIVVAHARYDPEEFGYRRSLYSVDLYNTAGVKLFEDISAPGRLLSGGNLLYFLTDEPPNGWTISAFRIMKPAAGTSSR